MNVVGIDEAGKGPVIGPLVMCGVLANSKIKKELKKIGVKDSKFLSSKQREELFTKIINLVKYDLQIINPDVIDEHVMSENSNLNKLELLTTIKILKKLKPDQAIIDCPDVNLENYKNSLLNKIHMDLIVEHKAEKYSVVAAASIIAKVTRDKIIDDLKKSLKVDFGSGYSSDPYTKRFMKKNWNKKKFFGIIRKSWATYKNIKKAKSQKSLLNF